jgi:pimeloyl-ACP methyl ester carboxylesterase
MTPTTLPSCPRADAPHGEPDCGRRLSLSECLERRRREATEGVVDTGRYRCRYVVWGHGPALILIPGLVGDSLTFTMLMARLQTQFCCISFDLPAGGDDGAALMTYRHEDHVSDLLALLDYLAIHECVPLGFSFGTTIALAAMHRQPARFARAILQDGFATRPLSPAEVLLASWARFLPGRLAQVPLLERLLERNDRQPFLDREPAVWEFFVERVGRLPLCALGARALQMHRLDLRPLVPAIQARVLLVSGEGNSVADKARTQEVRERLTLAAHAEIEGCGHQPHLSHPEVLAEVVGHFLHA